MRKQHKGNALTVIVAVGALCALTACSNDAGEISVSPPPITSEEGGPQASTAPSIGPTTTAPQEDTDSVCGLKGVEMAGSVLEPFEVDEAYIGTTNLFTSPKYGPGAQAPEGYYYCYQRSPRGAVLAAVGQLPQSLALDSEAFVAWLRYVMVPDDAASTPTMSTDKRRANNARVVIEGFRMLQYDGATALVDVAFTTSTSTEIRKNTAAVALVWVDGDWKSAPPSSSNDDESTVAVGSYEGYVLFPNPTGE